MKKCNICKKEQDDDQFIRKIGKLTTKSCLTCRDKQQKVRIKTDNAYTKKWKKENEQRVIDYNKTHKSGGDWKTVAKEKNYTNKAAKGTISTKRKKHVIMNDIEGKFCSYCKVWKPLEQYNNSNRYWDHLKHKCKKCFSDYAKANSQKIEIRNKKWRNENWDRYVTWRRHYHKIWTDNKLKSDPKFKILKRLRCRLRNAVKDQLTKKYDNTKILIGCSIDEFVNHLKSKFTIGMTMENYGKWHIDHIKPCVLFDLTKESEQRKCFHWSNMQPLWAKDNCSKGCKWTE